MSAQPELPMSLLAVWTCLTCNGAGRREDPETRELVRCRVCEGTGQLTYDPADTSAIPF